MNRTLVLALLTGLVLPQISHAQTPETRIAGILSDIRKEPDADLRSDYSAHLAEYIAAERNGAQRLDARTIDDIAALLSDENDWVRFYAAASLGFIGPEARRTLPLLERALEQARNVATLGASVRGVFQGLSSENAICAAIAQIDLGRRPAACERYR